MSQISLFKRVFKAIIQLGPNQMGLYASYRLGIKIGHYERALTASLSRLEKLYSSPLLKLHTSDISLPDQKTILDKIGIRFNGLLIEAGEVVMGYARLFGGQPVPIDFSQPGQLDYWTCYDKGNSQILGKDIKYIWEPGRFGWAYKLAMAYHLTNDEQYAESFWLCTEQFLGSNPPYLGPHWASAQEVAIRLVALAYAIQFFARSRHSTTERLDQLAKTIAIHAERIPPTLAYARSQNNNHLITEAMGLYIASTVLPEHPLAHRWYKLGCQWFQYAIKTQISPDGTYSQHSTNYHRLMLQAAIWVMNIHAQMNHPPFSPEVTSNLESATRWLWKLVDPETGRVPNLGHNDGAYIMPLSVCSYHDYRPVLYAAARSFLKLNLSPSGAWDDMSDWLCLPAEQSHQKTRLSYWHHSPTPLQLNNQSPYVLINKNNNSWSYLRVEKFTSRPAHADQLHMDLWWRGNNLALDPGTYQYNTLPPWENSLTSAFVHNTVVVDNREQMQRSGRFLYLDWAQSRIVAAHSSPDGGYKSITAEHDGYRKIGVIHSRNVTVQSNGHWEIIDHLEGSPGPKHTARLHWLLPDWEYEIHNLTATGDFTGYEILIKSPHGWILLKMGLVKKMDNQPDEHEVKFQLARAGEILVGSGTVSPITGWVSPTYGEKTPALACILETRLELPIEMRSEWIFPHEG